MEKELALYFWSLRDTLLYDIFNILSGKIYIIISCSVFIVFSFIELKKEALYFLLALLISVSLSDALCYRALKPAFKRPRPAIELKLEGQSFMHNRDLNLKKNLSMPSNHASNIFAFFIVYYFFIKRFWAAVFLNSLLISLSRVIIVKHYLSDIIAGAACGIIIGATVIYLTLQLKKVIKVSSNN